MMKMKKARCLFLICTLFLAAAASRGLDQPQWGDRYSRNMASPETGLPDGFDPATGKNVKWVAPLGSQTYSTPVVAGGKVLIGTNNDTPRDPAHKGDRGVLLCLDERDGRLVWQLLVPKFSKDPYTDWPHVGISSSATVEGGRVYVVTNRNEVVCLDLAGLANGNDGPFQDEARQLTPRDAPPEALTATDADILWVCDMPARINLIAHDSPHCSILVYSPYLFVNTSNGYGSDHKGYRNMAGPSLVVLDKATGRIVAQDDEAIGPRLFHCNWSSPALGRVGGRDLLFYGASDGVLHALEPPATMAPEGTVDRLKRAWRFECDPAAPHDGDMHRFLGNRREGPSAIASMPVFYENRLYVTVGGDIWWGKNKAWLQCIDPARAVTDTTSGLRWSFPMDTHCVATPAISDGLIYITDCAGNVHCVDAATGRPCWSHKVGGEIWSSALVADGKVFVGSRNNTLTVLAAGRQAKVLSSVKLDGPINNGSPVAANGVLYVATMKNLYAFQSRK